jgi:uncharacterized membrane protein YcaP (DUF421 family)
MWKLSLPWWEFIARAVVVYIFLLVILRITGKRQVGQLAPFDLVLLLVLSNALQNSMNGGDNTVTGGLISAVTLIGLNWLLGYATFRSKKIGRFVEGRPQVIVHNGPCLPRHHAERTAHPGRARCRHSPRRLCLDSRRAFRHSGK